MCPLFGSLSHQGYCQGCGKIADKNMKNKHNPRPIAINHIVLSRCYTDITISGRLARIRCYMFCKHLLRRINLCKPLHRMND